VARLRIVIRDQGLAADLTAVAGPAASHADVEAALAAARVVHGIDPNAVAQFAARLADPQFAGTVQVATGRAATNGTDGRLVGAFLVPKLPGTEQPDGHIDWHERELLHPADPDDVIARVVPAEAGEPGCTVTGTALPARPGQDLRQRLGSGVRLDGERVLAGIAGVVLATDRLLDVVPLHVHAGDVDLASGNLHSNGSLQVRGDVQPDCAVTAAGDVQVTGIVQDGRVTAGGSVQVAQGVLGSRAEIRAGQDLRCRHATGAQLHASAAVVVGDQLHHCQVAARDITVLTGRGTVVGGELRAARRIEVRTAGTAGGSATLLAVGDLLAERTELARLDAELAKLERTVLRAERGGGQLLAARKGPRLAVRTGDRVHQRRLELIAKQRELLRHAQIVVRDTLHPGVVVQFGTLRHTFVLPQHHAQMYFDPNTEKIVFGTCHGTTP
jgi:uncharacterized protein (DUF342 family)